MVDKIIEPVFVELYLLIIYNALERGTLCTS